MHPRRFSRSTLALCGLAVTALLVSACGSSSSPGSASSTSAASAVTQPSNPDDPFAPQPRAERTKFRVGLIASGQEPYAPMQLAQELGEFDAENLDVEVSQVPIQDAAVLLAQGKLDAAPLVLTVGVFNQLATNPDFRLGAGLPNLPASSRAGIWVRSELTTDGKMDPCDFKGKTVAFGPALKGATAAAGLLEELKKCDLTLDDISASPLQGPDAIIGLEQGSIDAAVVFDPLWEQLDAKGTAELIVPLYAEGAIFEGTSPTGWFFGPIRHKDPDAVKAFLRAVGRVTKQYFVGDYHANPETANLIASVLSVPADTFVSTPSLEADPTLPVDLDVVDVIQNAWIEIGLVDFDEPLPLDAVVDQSLRQQVFGN